MLRKQSKRNIKKNCNKKQQQTKYVYNFSSEQQIEQNDKNDPDFYYVNKKCQRLTNKNSKKITKNKLREIKKSYISQPDSSYNEIIDGEDDDNIKQQSPCLKQIDQDYQYQKIIEQQGLLLIKQHPYDKILLEQVYDFSTLTEKMHKIVFQFSDQLSNYVIGRNIIVSFKQGMSYKCNYCGKCFQRACSLGGHISSIHSENRKSLQPKTFYSTDKKVREAIQIESLKIVQKSFEKNEKKTKQRQAFESNQLSEIKRQQSVQKIIQSIKDNSLKDENQKEKQQLDPFRTPEKKNR